LRTGTAHEIDTLGRGQRAVDAYSAVQGHR
jgi:hypothetical protein